MFDVLATVVRALSASGIDHMVSGSVASARHGEIRSTQDIDIVIDPSPAQMRAFLELLGETDMYLGDGVEALAKRSQFNVIDSGSGWKVDLIIRSDRPYSVVELQRRQPVDIGGVSTWITTPEDSILSKLEWAKDSRSERQLRDVRALLSIQGDALDFEYLGEWAEALGVGGLLAEVLRSPES